MSIEKYEICRSIYHWVKIVSMHNRIHFVNGKQLGGILSPLLLWSTNVATLHNII